MGKVRVFLTEAAMIPVKLVGGLLLLLLLSLHIAYMVAVNTEDYVWSIKGLSPKSLKSFVRFLGRVVSVALFIAITAMLPLVIVIWILVSLVTSPGPSSRIPKISIL